MVDLRLPKRLRFGILIVLGLMISILFNAGLFTQAAPSAKKDPVIMAAGDIACDPPKF